MLRGYVPWKGRPGIAMGMHRGPVRCRIRPQVTTAGAIATGFGAAVHLDLLSLLFLLFPHPDGRDN